jgi:hypothetical protein
MAKQLRPLPKNTSEALQEQLVPSYNRISKITSNTVFSKNRAKEISAKHNTYKDFSVTLQDHDDVIKYYFENTIQPTVISNGSQLPVPIIYGSPERWKAVQADGFYRDKSGKIMVPLIMYKRDTLEKNRTLGNKLDGNIVQNYQIFEQHFNRRNSYDKFSVLTNRVPSKEYHLSVIPDYVTITYSCIIFTDYVAHINPIIEAINFASDSYWGDFSRFKFRARVDSFSTTNEVTTDDGRAVKATFNIVLNGYIIPDTINKQLASEQLYYGTSQLVFNFETTTSDLDVFSPSANVVNPGGATTIFEGSTNINLTVQGASILDSAYLSVSITKTASSIPTNSSAVFNAEFLNPSEGSSLPPTTKANFAFYINGVYVPQTYITLFTDNGNGICTLSIDTAGLGYTLEATDEIVAIGKFK